MVCPSWAAVLDSRTRVDADNRSTTNPLTGEPDAGNPPVRFGGRGKVKPLSLPLSHSRIFGFRLPPAMTSCRDGRAKRDGGLKTAIQMAVVCAGGDAAGPRVGRSLDERRRA